MYRKAITYTDFNGVTKTENFYFNLTKAEILRIETEDGARFSDKLKEMYEAKNASELLSAITYIILKAYGIKDPAGGYFDKSPEISRRFETSEAFSTLYMELMEDTDEAINFINNVFPVDTPIKKEDVDSILKE